MNNLLPLILFASSTTLTPGPNNFMIMNSGMNFGVKKSLPHYLGICMGFPMMVLMVALGLGELFVHYGWIKQVLKIFGSFYMLYLAWQILKSTSSADIVKTRKPLSFLQAALFQWVNPKAWLMAIGTISIFTLTQNSLQNALIISITYLLICLPCIGSWLLFGKVLQRILKTDRHRAVFNLIMALGLAASIGMIWVD